MKSKKDVLKQFQHHYKITRSGLKNQWKHIQQCQAFYAGDYQNYKTEFAFGRGSSKRIKEVQFNRVKPYVNAVVGFMAQHRRKPFYQAKIEKSEEQKALTDYKNGLSDYIRENTNADQMETKQDMDMIVGGIGVTDTAITLNQGTPTRDPNGEIIEERVDPLQCGYDPSSIAPNLLDSRWSWRSKDYDIEEAEELFDAEEEDFEIKNQEEDITSYEFNPFGGIQDKIGFEWADSERRMVRVYFYQWFDVESFYRVENPLQDVTDRQAFEELALALSEVEVNVDDELFKFDPASKILVMVKENRKDVKEIFERFGIPFNPMKDKRKVFYTAIISGDHIFDVYKSVSQQGFTLKFKTGDRDEVSKIWTGLVASMREPQRYYNKSLTELMIIIANNSRGGVMYEEGAVDNVQEFEAQWAMTNGAVRVNDGAISGQKIMPKATPHMNTGYEGVLETASMALSQVTGIDESFFGAMVSGNETAMLQRQRIKQATTTLAIYFDAIALYSKEQARMMLSFMRLLVEANDGRLFSMFDDDGQVIFEKMSLDFFADEYETTIGEAPETAVQKEYYTDTLISMATSMLSVGDIGGAKQMFASAVKFMPIPNRDKNDIVEVLIGEEPVDPRLVQQLQEQIQQLQGEQAQLASSKMQADIQSTLADIQKKQAEMQKTYAEVEETNESTENKALENDILYEKEYTKVNVNI